MEAREQKGDQGFWEARAAPEGPGGRHPRAQEGQPRLDPVFNEQRLLEHARTLGLHVDKIAPSCRMRTPRPPSSILPAAQKLMAQLDADLEAADAVDIGGTPQFFLNGRRLGGEQPVEQFSLVIDDELKKAEALLARGVPAARVYDEAMQAAKEPEPPEIKLIDPAPPEAPWKGLENARVEFHVFSDFECPYRRSRPRSVRSIERSRIG
jgi:hypothetical protein